MSEITSSPNQISIAYYVKAVNDRYGTNRDISHSLFETGLELAESMQSILMTKEDLKTADEAFPRSTTPVGVDRNAEIICPEILAWAIAMYCGVDRIDVPQNQILVVNIRQILI